LDSKSDDRADSMKAPAKAAEKAPEKAAVPAMKAMPPALGKDALKKAVDEKKTTAMPAKRQ
jgi:hypothetical protein